MYLNLIFCLPRYSKTSVCWETIIYGTSSNDADAAVDDVDDKDDYADYVDNAAISSIADANTGVDDAVAADAVANDVM